MRALLMDQRGISAIVGAVLIAGMIVVALGTYFVRVTPEYQREYEYLHMQSVKQSFVTLKNEIAALRPGDVHVVGVKMNAEVAPLQTSTKPGLLSATAAYYVDQISPTDGTWVAQDATPAYSGTDNVVWVRPTTGSRRWTYFKFDIQSYNDLIYYENVDGTLVKATLWVYVDNMLFLENGGWVPVDVVAQGVEDDSWTETGASALTWAAAQGAYLPTAENLDVKAGSFAPDENGEWIGFDVTRWVEYHVDLYPSNHTVYRYVSICLREGTPSPQFARGVAFISDDVSSGYGRNDRYAGAFPWAMAYKPHLELIYIKPSKAGSAEFDAFATTDILVTGNIKFESQNEKFPKQTYIYEDGALILAQYYRNTMISTPDDFLNVTLLPGGLTRVQVTRYRIAGGGTFGGTGAGSLQLSVLENRWLIYSEVPNRDKVTVTVRTDYESAWGDYLQYRVDMLKHEIAPDDPDYEYNEMADFDYNRLAVTIRGSNLGGEAQDIVYCEKLVDIRVTVR